jgi:hypothetical protein
MLVFAVTLKAIKNYNKELTKLKAAAGVVYGALFFNANRCSKIT